jgi:hypothetical protein
MKYNIVPPPTAATLTQENDYSKSTDKEVEQDLSQMLSSMGLTDAVVDEFIGVDDEMPVESPPDAIERGDQTHEDSDSSDSDNPLVTSFRST